MKIAAVVVLGCLSATAQAATEQEVRQAFEKAQKKGAVAVYEDRCGGMDSVYFPGGSAAKTAIAMSALAMAQEHGKDEQGCAAGLQPGQSQILELYPDGTIKAR